MVSTVISSCFFDTTCSAPASGLSVPKASECRSTRIVPGGQELREALAPFDEHDGLAIEEIIETERGDLTGLVEAVEVDMVDAAMPVLVDEGESGARNFVRLRRAETLHDAFGEGRLAGA